MKVAGSRVEVPGRMLCCFSVVGRAPSARGRGPALAEGNDTMSALLPFVLAALAAAPAADAPAPLRARWLYNPAERPASVQVALPPGSETGELVLMSARGDVHSEPIQVHGGECDLNEIVPHLARLRAAAYLQLMIGDEPVGSALVVQPMLSRMVPVVEDALNPSGMAYTKVTKWIDERAIFGELAEGAAPVIMVGSPAGGDAAAAGSADPWLANQREDGRLFGGVRLYAERDAIMHTTAGDIRLAMAPEHAPNTAWNFVALAEGGFYRDIPFHRIVPYTRDGDPFVIQAGDPTATGSGGPGFWLPLEPSGLAHDFGVVSMARDRDPDSAGSQIFICLSREGTARLDQHYCAFGYAVDGAETIMTIAASELADVAAGRPAQPPLITSVELVPAPPRRPGAGRPDHRVERPAPTPGAAPPKRAHVPR